MWSIIIATILIDAKEPAMPVIIYSYPTLRACRLELAEIGKKLDYKFVVSPLLGYSLKRIQIYRPQLYFVYKINKVFNVV